MRTHPDIGLLITSPLLQDVNRFSELCSQLSVVFQLRTSLVNVISKAKVNTLEDAQRTSSVLGTVTKETDEVSAEAQVRVIFSSSIHRHFLSEAYANPM